MEFKELEQVKNFPYEFRKNILEYIELMYDETSELNKIDDFEERKKQACKKADLDYSDLFVKEIIDIKDDSVNNLVFLYHVYNNSNKYHSLCSHQQLFWEIQRKINDPTESIKTRASLLEENEAIIQRMDKLQEEIFGIIDKKKIEKIVKRALAPEERIKNNGFGK